MTPQFVHLRLHSPYSLLEGAIRLPQLVEACKKHHMPAVAVADRNNLFGALEIAEEMSAVGVQAITAITLSLIDADGVIGDIALYVQNETGYLNLMALASMAYRAEQVDVGVSLDQLAEYAEGLICLTGGPEGPINRRLGASQVDAAHHLLQQLAAIFGPNLYIELQRYTDFETPHVEDALVEYAYAHDLPLVATNQCFFVHGDEFRAHDALICIADGTYVDQTDRRQYTIDHRLKSPEEMLTLFADLPEATANSVEIAQRCAYRPRGRAPILPAYPCDDEAAELARQAQEGLQRRLGQVETSIPHEQYFSRLAYELEIIEKMGFPGYFLIVADFIQWAKSQGIAVGPGRGSGAGSVVAWALTITDLDPLRFNLLFERFLNPERVSMPDFDIDFCQSRRDEVIAYVQQKYGVGQVAQIITFGKLQARAVLRDVGRVLQMPYGQVDRLCKLVPNNPANPKTLQQALDEEPRLQEARRSETLVDELISISLTLEGLYRHASTHAAGVVIGDRPLEQLVALYRDPKSDTPVTQFNMKWVEKAGLVKFDFLGLKTLTVIEKALALIAKRGKAVDIEHIPFDDAATYTMLGEGDTVGVFQLESAGMRDVLRRMKPDCLEDIIALVALYRPGPMDNIPRFIACKKGEEQPDYLHETLKPVLEETYGVMIYQEQVMQIAQILSGYSLGEADLLRRAMGKKIQKEMDEQKERFILGAVDNQVDQKKASAIFDQVDRFAGYGFNKSHAAAYALIAYQTAYLKANYPAEFYAASMSLDFERTEKLQGFKQDAETHGIQIIPPHINRSHVQFDVADDGIVYALSAIRNVGAQAMQLIVEEREAHGDYQDIFDFARRTSSIGLNRRLMEYLIFSGALDCLEPDRARLSAGLGIILGEANVAATEQKSKQESLFGSEDLDALTRLPDAAPWSQLERLSHELTAIGFYLSGHPLDDYQRPLKRVGAVALADLEKRVGGEVLIAGTILKVDERKSQKGKPFAFVTLSDPMGQFEIVLFSDTLEVSRPVLRVAQGVVITAQVSLEEGQLRLIGRAVRDLDEVVSNARAGLRVYVDQPAALVSLRENLNKAPSVPLHQAGQMSLILLAQQHEVEMQVPLPVSVTPKLAGAIKAIRGVVHVEEV